MAQFQLPPPRPPYYLARPPPGPQPPGPRAPGPDAGPDEEDQGYMPTDEELSRLAELGVVDEEMASNLRRQREAELAASAGPPEGRTVSHFGTYVAANPLEHMAAAGGRIAALVRKKKLHEEEQGITERKRAAYKGLYDVGFQAYGYPKPFSW